VVKLFDRQDGEGVNWRMMGSVHDLLETAR